MKWDNSENLYNKILSDKLEFNGGMIIENIVAQMLKAAGHELYFFQDMTKKMRRIAWKLIF